MPKSSSEKPTPYDRSAVMVAMVVSMSSTSRLSVSSSLSWAEGAPVMASTRATSSTKLAWRNWRELTLTAMVRCDRAGSLCQLASSLHAVCSTQRPSGRIRPVSSASGMNCAGDTMPRCGWAQRTSASTPTQRPDWWICGWKCSKNSSCISAERRSVSSPARAVTTACMSGSKKRSVLRPAVLAWYMARSACLSSSPTVVCSPVKGAMPMLGVLRYW